jgi:pantoate--beta-alanine ligase
VTIRVCPIVREIDGLAMSSRNRYLTPHQRSNATVLFRALETARQRVTEGERDAAALRNAMIALIEQTPGATLDYVELVDNATLEPVTRIDQAVLAAVAVNFDGTRLIDNMVLQPR